MTELVLLPGTLCDERLFAHQVQNLADIATPRIGDLTTADSITGMAEAVLADAPPKFALAGLSLGGIVAMEIMRIAPERVSRLALLDTNHLPPTDAQLDTWEQFDDLVAAGRFEEITTVHLLDALVHNHAPQIDELIIDMAASIGAGGFSRQNRAQPGRPDNRHVLPQISCPTLVLCGAEERVCPVELHAQMAAVIPGAELVVVPDAGHLSTLDQPQLVTAALRAWLQGREHVGAPAPVEETQGHLEETTR